VNISQMKFKNYRNLKNITVEPDPSINIIFGNNAQGKTNFIEAIWIFTAGRSFRQTKDSDLIKFEKASAQISMSLHTQGRKQKLQIDLINKKRIIKINEVQQSIPSGLLGKLRAVVFSPNHLALIKDGPIIRRKFLDVTLCQLKPVYAKILMSYNRILTQKNMLLKNIKKKKNPIDLLDVWDDQLSELGSKIMFQREKHLETLKKYAEQEYKGISKNKEKLKLSYISTVYKELPSSTIELKEIFLSKLKKVREHDLLFGNTSIGAHRDDFSIDINGKKAKLFASQGQQRSAVIALKLAETTVLEEKSGESPIVLLDDVLSELDTSRQDYILNAIKNRQIFITCCDPNTVLKLGKGSCFEVINGNISKKE